MKTRTTLKVASLLCFSLMLGCSKTRTDEKPPKPVKVKAVEMHSSASSVRYSASIRPAAQVDVAFKVGGYIDAIAQQRDSAGQWRHLQAGDIVRKGTVLARVRQSDYVARVNEAKSQHGEARSALETNNSQLKEAIAAVETARAQVNDSQAYFERTALDFERARILFSTQSITKPDYDAAKAQYEIAQAKLEAARGQLKSAEARVATSRAQIGAAESRIKTAEASTFSATIPLQDTQLKAPMTAVVIDRKIEIGTLVSQGVTGFVLADLTSVKAAFGVPDLALQSLRLGDTLKVTTDGLPGTEFSGHISRISPSADQNSRVFDARRRRAVDRSIARCRHHAFAPSADHSRRDGHRAVSTRIARRTTLAANVLRADWGAERSDLHHAAFGAGDLFHLRARFEAGEMGEDPIGRSGARNFAHCNAGG